MYRVLNKCCGFQLNCVTAILGSLKNGNKAEALPLCPPAHFPCLTVLYCGYKSGTQFILSVHNAVWVVFFFPPLCFLTAERKSALVIVNCPPCRERNNLSVDGSSGMFGCFKDASNTACRNLNWSPASLLQTSPIHVLLFLYPSTHGVQNPWCWTVPLAPVHPIHSQVPISTLLPRCLWIPSTSPHLLYHCPLPAHASLNCFPLDLPPPFLDPPSAQGLFLNRVADCVPCLL